jgi:hypothetical protein
MKITMNRVILASDAMIPLMRAAGLSSAAQRGLCRLWQTLGDARDCFVLAETQLAEEYGTLGADRKLTFKQDSDAAEYSRRRAALLGEEVEITPIRIPDEPALWAASTPMVMLRLDGILLIGEEGEAC